MTVAAVASRPQPFAAAGAVSAFAFGAGRPGAGLASRTDAPAPFAALAQPGGPPLTPVQQGQLARAVDQAAALAAGPATGNPTEAEPAVAHPIQVASSDAVLPDGTRLSTITIGVQANFRLDGGTLPEGRTAQAEADAIETAIERNFSKSYRDPDGGVTRYVTDVDMTVGGPDTPAREQFVLVDATDPRLFGGLGIAPGFEEGRVAYVSDEAGARTAPHEFGHLAGLRHTAQVSLGCVTAPGIDIENLMSQTGCSPTSQQIERSQLEQISGTAAFR